MEERAEGAGWAEDDPHFDDLLFDEVGEEAWEWATSPEPVFPL